MDDEEAIKKVYDQAIKNSEISFPSIEQRLSSSKFFHLVFPKEKR